MMDFSDFKKYLADHFQEIEYDIKHLNTSAYQNVSLSPDDYRAISTIAIQTSMIILQNYHAWIEEHREKHP